MFSKTVDTTSVSNKCRASKFRIGVKFQGILNNMTCAFSAFTRAKNEAAMWNAFVVAIKFFLRNEVYYSFITYEVVFHSFDFVFNFSFVRIRSSHYIALTKVTFVAINVWSFTIADSFKVLFFRNSVLTSIKNTINTTNSIGVTLGNATAPECIRFTLRQDAFSIYTL